jgi:hypothetical protein
MRAGDWLASLLARPWLKPIEAMLFHKPSASIFGYTDADIAVTII